MLKAFFYSLQYNGKAHGTIMKQSKIIHLIIISTAFENAVTGLNCKVVRKSICGSNQYIFSSPLFSSEGIAFYQQSEIFQQNANAT